MDMFEEADQQCTKVHSGRFIATEERVEYYNIFRSVMVYHKINNLETNGHIYIGNYYVGIYTVDFVLHGLHIY